MNGDLMEAVAGQSVTLTLTDEIDCSRGDVLSTAEDAPEVADQFEATIVWMDDEPLLPGRSHWLKIGTQMVSAHVQPPKYQVNVEQHGASGCQDAGAQRIGVAEVATDRPIVFEPYDVNREMGGFILIDKITNATIAAGMLHFSLRRSKNVHWQAD